MPSTVEYSARSSAGTLATFADPSIVAAIPPSALVRDHVADVDGDGRVSSVDAMQIIQFLNRTPVVERPAAMVDAILAGGSLYDTNGDGIVTPLDVLRVIGELNRQQRSALQVRSSQTESIDALHASEDTSPKTAAIDYAWLDRD